VIGLDLFLRPGLWPLLFLVPAFGLVLVALDRARARRLGRMLGARAAALTPTLDRGRRRLRRWLFPAGLGLALTAVLQPAWGEGSMTVTRRRVDLVIALDVSRSMLARDHDPDRLGSAKAAIRALGERAVGDRMALVLFAGEAVRAVPLTSDLRSLADLAELASPLSVERGGTDLGAAILTAVGALDHETGRQRAVLLLTDGGDHEGHGLRAAREAAGRDIVVHCVGFGSERGAKIPVDGEFLRDRAGRDVVASMDVAGLTKIVGATGGAFVSAAETERPLVSLYDDQIRPKAAASFEAEKLERRENRFQWALLPGLLLWTLSLCVNERRR